MANDVNIKMNNSDSNSNTPKRSKKKKGIENLSFFDKIQIILAFSVIFILLFLIMYRNSKISESFSELNNLKNDISKIQKENVQLEVNIQGTLNLSNVEQSAKELLGMQKLNNSQTIYISLPKKDYIETSVEAVVVDNESIIDKIKDKIKKWF
ncbi:MAG: cell division protein FtsL [Clostridia bacterium]|nr:cell division protein FtsL [Clostridia bacterium]